MKVLPKNTLDYETSDVEILIAGLGGMGVVNLTRQLGSLLRVRYPQVFTKESRGIAKRRASVVGSVRAGYQVRSPELYFGSTHYLLGLEPLEALRFTHFIRPGTLCLLTDIQVQPSGLAGRDYQYPSLQTIRKYIAPDGDEALWLPVSHWLRQQGLGDRYASSALFGALAAVLGFDEKIAAEILTRNRLGRDQARNAEALTWGYCYLHDLMDKRVDRQLAAVA